MSHGLVNLNKLLFGFILGNATIDVIFVLNKMNGLKVLSSDENKSLYMCFVDLKKAFD